MAVAVEPVRDITVVSLDCPDRTFPSVGALHAPAIRLERAIRSLYGLEPAGLPEKRPWLDSDFGRGVRHPLGAREPAPPTRPPYTFLPVEGESPYQISVGPVHAGIIEPGHFRFTADGETVVRLEQRLGYVHKGIELLMAGATLERRGEARRPHLRRQHGRLFLCLRASRRSRVASDAAAARGLPARADGRA